MGHRKQTAAIKKALLKAGYPVKSVRRDTGTAKCWIDIELDIEKDGFNEIRRQVELLAAMTIGREDWHENCILVSC